MNLRGNMEINKKEKKEIIDKFYRKYFWEQKVKEVLEFIGIIMLFTIIPFILGKILYLIGENKEERIIVIWAIGCGITLLTVFIGVLTFGIIKAIKEEIKGWIKKNKRKAKARAIEEFRRRYEIK